MQPGPDISFEKVGFSWEECCLFHDFELHLQGGKTTVFLGRSGIGKSTLLRLVAGLLTPDRGKIISSNSCPLKQQIAWMGQQDLLYPWLTVRENIMLGSRLQGEKPNISRASVLLEQVQLAGYAHALPAALSGGMRQRVALARTLYLDRPVVLMDEPFATLDVMTKLSLQTLTANVLRGKTVLLITHDPLEACRMAHEICLLSETPLRVDRFAVPNGEPPRAVEDTALLQTQGELFHRLNSDEK